MNVEIGTEAAQFEEKELINRILVAVQGTHRPRDASSKGHVVDGTEDTRHNVRGHIGRGRDNIAPS
jgi:hypothetical protein